MSNNSSVFDRLYSHQTSSSRAKRKVQTLSEYRTTPKAVPVQRSRPQKPLNPKTKNEATSPVAKKKIELALKTRLFCSSKYHPKSGFSQLSVHGLHLHSAFQDYEKGSLSPGVLAGRIIEALFFRDFMDGKRWDIDSPVVEEMEAGVLYQASKEATWDWKDIYSVATAKGKVRFSLEENEIRVVDYSYYVAG